MSARDIDLRGPLEGVRYERRDHIAFITLDRPERGNSLTPAMQGIFRAIWAEVRDDDDVRVAVLGAAGERHFSTGFDLSETEAEAEDVQDVFSNRPLQESVFWSAYQNRVWKPVICAVNGLCVGGGHHFVVDSDIVVASENAAFMDTHVNVGMVGALENVGLARRLPLGAALRMTLMGRHYRMPARRAYELGLVDELVATPDEARTLAESMARQLLDNSPQAMALSKQAVWGSMERGYGEALEAAWSLLRIHWQHPDFTEGPRAFAEKRAPRWNPDPDARTTEPRTTEPRTADAGTAEARAAHGRDGERPPKRGGGER
ncbi:MAG: enoyl-CoA hydratase/isomerase family protein [Myxococcota bacterium]